MAAVFAATFAYDMTEDEKSGRIGLDGDVIRYRSSVYGDWDLPIQQVRIIGEFTNQNGPFADDWFLAFIVNADEMWYEASISAAGCDEFISQTGSHLGVELTSELVYSTDFNSRILWPADIAGTELFTFSRDIPPDAPMSRPRRILSRLGLSFKVYQTLASDVQSWLDGTCR